MWVCAKCGEPHEDHFKICWKCASQEMEEHVAAGPPPQAPARIPEPRLRSSGSILVRVAIAFVIGVILGGAAYQGFLRRAAQGDDAATGVGIFALAAGVGLAILVGIFFWVIFPYEPSAGTESVAKNETPEDSPS